jgi:hypothetical protein
MHHLSGVHVGHSADDLSEDKLHKIFRQPWSYLISRLLDKVVEILASAQLHHQMHMCP